jgi:hypothetical protein
MLAVAGFLARCRYAMRVTPREEDATYFDDYRALESALLDASVEELVGDYGPNLRTGSRYVVAWLALAEHEEELRALRDDVAALAGAIGAPYPISPFVPTRTTTGAGTTKFQMGSPSHYGHVQLRIAPHDDPTAIRVEVAADAQLGPEPVAEAERRLFDKCLFFGVVSAARLAHATGFVATITGGRFHEVDSRPGDFDFAAQLAFAEAIAAQR